jgi:WD40 repeat protein
VHHVFVSYSRADAAWVTGLTRRLEAGGQPTWLDQRDIPMTLPWFEQIGDAIAAADLFLICDSPASRESANCGAEARLAFDAGKRSLEVKVGGDPAAAAAEVDRAIAGLDPAYRVRTELAVLARDWDRGGRERSALISARVRRRLAAGLAVEPPPDPTERAFLKASRSRSRRRTALSVLVGLTIAVSGLFAVVINAALKRSNKENDHQAAVYMRTHAELANVGNDPYQGLDEAAALGQNESATDASVIAGALSTGVPDDAFQVPASARRFASDEIGQTVGVVGAGGSLWQRPAGARDVREARRSPPGAFAAPPRGAQSLRVRPEPHSATVEVLRGGAIWRRIVFSQPPQVLQLSPDGRELAAAGGGLVEIADLQLGAVRTTLSGAAGSIRDLAWSADGGRLWALGGKLVVSWDTRDGAVLLDDPNARFEALLPAARESAAWAVARDGELRMFNTGNGTVLATLHVPDEILSGAGAPDGSFAALSGERGLWIVPLRNGGEPRLMRIPECDLGRAAFIDAKTLFLPCLSGDLLQISAARRTVERHIHIARVGAFAVRALPRSGLLLVSDTLADLFAVRGPGQVKELFRSRCGGSITRIGVAATGRVIAPVGSGTGISGCLRRGVLKGDDPAERSNWSFVAVDDEGNSALAEASAVSRDGETFAYGYSDGTVILHPTTDILPTQTIENVVGEIRDMYVTPGNQLLVATAAGIVQRIPLCDRCLSNRSMARLAKSRLERGLAIGTAVREAPG